MVSIDWLQIYPLYVSYSLPTYHVSEQMENYTQCTSYNFKLNSSWTEFNSVLLNNTYPSVSFKPAFIHFSLVIDMLALLQFSYAMVRVHFNVFIWRGKQSECFRVFLKQSEFFRLFGLTKIPLFIFCPCAVNVVIIINNNKSQSL